MDIETKYFSNGLIDNSNNCQIIGKILFWTVLHSGYWPQWLNKMHIMYILEEQIDSINVLKSHNKKLHTLYSKITANSPNWRNEFKEWVKNRDIVSIYILYIKKFFIITILILKFQLFSES